MIIGIVGPCAAGKSTLSIALQAIGLKTRHIAQEHSYVADMWMKISAPDILVYLHVSYEVSLQRRPQNWTCEDYQAEIDRLEHARNHADLTIDTDPLQPSEVFQRVLAFISQR